VARIDINADLGEGDPYDEELLTIVSSCNIACGGHAGDARSMHVTVTAAVRNGVAIGAHPSYADREGFGRRSQFQRGRELLDSLLAQICALRDVALDQGSAIGHVKPHGALYNDAALDADLADTVAMAVVEVGAGIRLVGPPDSELQRAAERHALQFVGEGFIDRAYMADGHLLPRTEPGAVHDSLEKIVAQAMSLATQQSVTSIDGQQVRVAADTLCVHGDTPGAADAARAVYRELQRQGIEVRAVDR